MTLIQKVHDHYRLLKWISITIAIFIAVWLYFFAYDRIRIVRLENYFSPANGYTIEFQERYFTQTFASSRDIQSYLNDSTFLIFSQGSGNSVFYFDNDHSFLYWRDNHIENGKWWATPYLEFIYLGNRRRIAVVYSFCKWFFETEPEAQQDNCRFAENVESVLPQGRDTSLEIRKGNVFRLGSSKLAPTRLPLKKITIDSLMLMISIDQSK